MCVCVLVPADCEGYWTTCDTGCQSYFQVTRMEEPGGECPERYTSPYRCAEGEGNAVNCIEGEGLALPRTCVHTLVPNTH